MVAFCQIWARAFRRGLRMEEALCKLERLRAARFANRVIEGM
jgi:hypothetical protein